MDNILILTARFGQGHCSAAAAIREEILRQQPHACVTVTDLIAEAFPVAQRGIYGVFHFWVRHCPTVYNKLNRLAECRAFAPFKHLVARRLEQLLACTQADLVISTFPVCSQYVAASLKRSGRRIPLYTYVTDITVHEEWLAPGTDRYYVGAQSTMDALLARGIPAERIVLSGIPVRGSFGAQEESALPHDKHEVLVLGGGLGLIPGGDAFLRRLSENERLHVTLLAGHNQKLLRRAARHYPRVETVGFTEDIAAYYHRAELVISKSGGITTFEAIAAQTPLLVLPPFLMQEIGNAEFIERQGLGNVLWSRSADPAEEAERLLGRPEVLQQMRRNMRALAAGWQSACPVEASLEAAV